MAASSSTRYFSHQSRIYDLEDASIWAQKNKNEIDRALLSGRICGCFRCLSLLSPADIVDYLPEDPLTAICPKCFVDAIIVDSELHPVSVRFLMACRSRHFW